MCAGLVGDNVSLLLVLSMASSMLRSEWEHSSSCVEPVAAVSIWIGLDKAGSCMYGGEIY